MRAFAKSASRGFTLLELAIVITIIGLIAGGIVAGRAIIRSSEMQGALREYDQYLKAVQEFQDKYHALPGDMMNATSIWSPKADCTGSTGSTTLPATPSTATCNGDGDGIIGGGNRTPPSTMARYRQEQFLFWQHLSNAGLIEGRFNGSSGSNGWVAVRYVNVPSSRMSPAVWELSYIPPAMGNGYVWDDLWGHVLMLNGTSNGGGFPFVAISQPPAFPQPASSGIAPVMTAREAYEMDSKIDDGKPGTGKLRNMRYSSAPNCIDQASDTSADTMEYDTGKSTKPSCIMLFITGF